MSLFKWALQSGIAATFIVIIAPWEFEWAKKFTVEFFNIAKIIFHILEVGNDSVNL